MEARVIQVLLLGDEKCGKTSFLSSVALQPQLLTLIPQRPCAGSHADAVILLPPGAFGTRTRRLSAGEEVNPIRLLRDMDQPFGFDVNLGGNQYRLEFHDTSSPENWRLLEPDVIVICYDISQRLSLINMNRYVGLPLPPACHLVQLYPLPLQTGSV